MTESPTIYMPLLNEGTDVWAPVVAEHVSGSLYRVLGPAPDDQEWEFPAGSIVRVVQRTFACGETALAAVAEEAA